MIKYWVVQIDELKHLAAGSPQRCVQFLFPDTRDASFDLTRLLTEDLGKRYNDALIDLIIKTAKQPSTQHTPPTEAQIKALVGPLALKSPMLNEPQKYYDNPEALCGAFVGFYTTILALPPALSAAMLRYLDLTPSSGESTTTAADAVLSAHDQDF